MGPTELMEAGASALSPKEGKEGAALLLERAHSTSNVSAYKILNVDVVRRAHVVRLGLDRRGRRRQDLQVEGVGRADGALAHLEGAESCEKTRVVGYAYTQKKLSDKA